MSRSAHAPSCGTDIVLPLAGVTLADRPAIAYPCPLPLASRSPVPQVAGVEVDGFGGSQPRDVACVGPRTIDGLPVCIDSAPAYGVLVAQVRVTGGTPITVKIGLSASGKVARAVLYSMRRSH